MSDLEEKKAVEASDLVTSNQFLSFFEESFVTVKDHFDEESKISSPPPLEP